MAIKEHNPSTAPSPVGPYSVATEANGFIFLSGQIGVDASTGLVVEGGVPAQTHQAISNASAILAELGLGLADIAKTTVFMTDLADFTVMNEAYGLYFRGTTPARSTVEVAGLPLGLLVEFDFIAAR